MYEYYDLHLDMVDNLIGGIPKHPDIVRRWQEARMPSEARMAAEGITVEGATAQTVEDLGSQAIDPDEEAKSVWTGFVEKDGIICLETRNVKAMFKESANIVKDMRQMKKLTGDKKIALRARVAERVFVLGMPGRSKKFIPLYKGGEPQGSAESLERPIHVMTARGQRTALKKTDFVNEAQLDMVLQVLNDGVITEDILRIILEHAALNGLGTDRSQGNGMFDYELKKIES